jgi:hypothetical protein
MSDWKCPQCGFDAEELAKTDHSERAADYLAWSQNNGFNDDQPSAEKHTAKFSAMMFFRNHLKRNPACAVRDEKRVLRWANRRKLEHNVRHDVHSLKNVPTWLSYFAILVSECHECGCDIVIDPTSNRHPRLLCSKCRVECRQKTFQEFRDRNKVEHSERPCEHCGKNFSPIRSTAKFCSTKCRVYAAREASR